LQGSDTLTSAAASRSAYLVGLATQTTAAAAAAAAYATPDPSVSVAPAVPSVPSSVVGWAGNQHLGSDVASSFGSSSTSAASTCTSNSSADPDDIRSGDALTKEELRSQVIQLHLHGLYGDKVDRTVRMDVQLKDELDIELLRLKNDMLATKIRDSEPCVGKDFYNGPVRQRRVLAPPVFVLFF
jgi:hypothetical protein